MFNARLYACNVYVCVCNTCIYVWLRTSTKEISAKSKDSRSRRRTEQCCELIINYFSTQAAERYRRFTPYLFYIFHLSAKTPSLSLSFFLSLSLSLSHSLFLSLSLSLSPFVMYNYAFLCLISFLFLILETFVYICSSWTRDAP